MQKPTLGHIDCPFCAASKSMRVTHDKNGKPFCHCDDCNGQMRVGGNTFREKKFIDRYPFAGQKAAEIPVTVTANEWEPDKPKEPVEEKPPVSVPASQPIKKKASWSDVLGVGK